MDTFLNSFVIWAPVILSFIVILVPPKKEDRDAHRTWRVILVILAVVFTIISSYQQKRSANNARIDAGKQVRETTENVAKAVRLEDASLIEAQRLRIGKLEEKIDLANASSLNSAKSQFEVTMRRFKSIAKKTQAVNKIAEHNLSAILGKDSYPCIFVGGFIGDRPIISVGNRGPNPLTGVAVKIIRGGDRVKTDSFSNEYFFDRGVEIGTIAPHGEILVPHAITLTPGSVDNNGVIHYDVELTTQNGLYYENLSFFPVIEGPRHWRASWYGYTFGNNGNFYEVPDCREPKAKLGEPRLPLLPQ